METNAPDTQLPAGRGDWHGWATGISLGVIGLVMIVLFVLPGFLAAEFSWTSGFDYSVNGDATWDGDYSGPVEPAYVRLQLAILAPSGWLMERSPLIRRFYNWQYHLAGGQGFEIHITG